MEIYPQLFKSNVIQRLIDGNYHSVSKTDGIVNTWMLRPIIMEYIFPFFADSDFQTIKRLMDNGYYIPSFLEAKEIVKNKLFELEENERLFTSTKMRNGMSHYFIWMFDEKTVSYKFSRYASYDPTFMIMIRN